MLNDTNNDKLIDWITKKAKYEYADDVSIVLAYGSFINGTANAFSDVDCYFIPKTKRGIKFANSFIINGIGYDIFPMNWQRVKNIAKLKETLLPLVGDVKILFYSTKKDLKKFKSLQRQLQSNISKKSYTEKIAKEKFVFASEQFAKMNIDSQFSDLRVNAGKIIMMLADIVMLHNNDYFHYGLKKQYDDLKTIKDIPDDFLVDYIKVIKLKEKAELINTCKNILNSVSVYMGWGSIEFLAMEKELISKNNTTTDFQLLANFYEEIISTFNKIYLSCEKNDYVLAFLSAVCLQNDLDELCKENNLKKYCLLNYYDSDNLSLLAVRTKDIENNFVDIIINGGGNIKNYSTFEDFQGANL